MSNKPAYSHLKSNKHHFKDEVIDPPEAEKPMPKIMKYVKKILVKDSVHSKIAKLVGISGISMNKIAVDDEIRELIYYKYKVWPSKSPTTIAKTVTDHCKEVVEAITKQIKDLNSYTIMFDEWTSRGNERYLNLIIRTESTEYNLGVIKVEGSASASNLLDLIKEKLKLYDISIVDVFSMTADGASVNRKISKDTGIHIQQCYNHGANLNQYLLLNLKVMILKICLLTSRSMNLNLLMII